MSKGSKRSPLLKRQVLAPLSSNLNLQKPAEVKRYGRCYNNTKVKLGTPEVIKRCHSAETKHHSYLDKQWLHNLENLTLWEQKQKPLSVGHSCDSSEVIMLKTPSINEKVENVVDPPVRYSKITTCSPVPSISSRKQKKPPIASCLNDEELTSGQKKYLWSTARCYSVQQLRSATRRRMKDILDYEFMKRYVTKSVPSNVKNTLWKEYCEYRQQIDRRKLNTGNKPRSASAAPSITRSVASLNRPKSHQHVFHSSNVEVEKSQLGDSSTDAVRNNHLNESIKLAPEDQDMRYLTDDLVIDVESSCESEDMFTVVSMKVPDTTASTIDSDGGAPRRVRPKSAKYQQRTGSMNSMTSTGSSELVLMEGVG